MSCGRVRLLNLKRWLLRSNYIAIKRIVNHRNKIRIPVFSANSKKPGYSLTNFSLKEKPILLFFGIRKTISVIACKRMRKDKECSSALCLCNITNYCRFVKNLT